MDYSKANKYRMKEDHKVTGYIKTDEVRAKNIENAFDELQLKKVEK